MRRHLAAAAGYAAGYSAVVLLERALARLEEERRTGADLEAGRLRFAAAADGSVYWLPTDGPAVLVAHLEGVA